MDANEQSPQTGHRFVFSNISLVRNSSALQAVCTATLCKISIEGSERQMTGFAGDFQNETIGEAQCGTGAEMSQRQRDDIRILERQFLVVQHAVDRVCDLRG